MYASSRVADVLLDAATTGGPAPSTFNTQPWRWRVGNDTLQLYADRRRLLPGARALIQSLLPNRGQPQLVLRIGIPTSAGSPPATPRRSHQQSIEVCADAEPRC